MLLCLPFREIWCLTLESYCSKIKLWQALLFLVMIGLHVRLGNAYVYMGLPGCSLEQYSLQVRPLESSRP